MLLKNGTIHTMARAGSFAGDILIQGDRLFRVDREISTEEAGAEPVIDAGGWQIYPGLIDAHVHLVRSGSAPEKDVAALCADALASGVTTQAVWPERDGLCRLYHGHMEACPAYGMRCVCPDGMTDAGLQELMEEAAAQQESVACEVNGEGELRRILTLARETGCRLILARLTDCGDALEELIARGGQVILGACVLRNGSEGYALAARLQRAGVRVALTADYPATRLHHLPLCAGLCVRAGMDHDAALRAITIDAAKLLGVANVCGSIEEGKRADLTIFDGDPLLLATGRIMTVSGGNIAQKC